MSSLMTEAFVTVESLGKLMYEDPLCGEVLRLHDAWGVDIMGDKYIAPSQFLTDGGSVPRFFWCIMGHPYSKARAAYLLHDAAYHRRLLLFEADGIVRTIDKAEADELMYQVGLWRGMGKTQMKSIYQAVHSFGSGSWEFYARKSLPVDQLLATRDYKVLQMEPVCS